MGQYQNKKKLANSGNRFLWFDKGRSVKVQQQRKKCQGKNSPPFPQMLPRQHQITDDKNQSKVNMRLVPFYIHLKKDVAMLFDYNFTV